KDYRVPHPAFAIRGAFSVMPFVYELASEKQASGMFVEKQNAPAVLRCVANGTFARLHDHVANLAHAEVLENPIVTPSIGVAMMLARGARDDKDRAKDSFVVIPIGGDDAAPLRSAKPRVNVPAPVIDATLLKAPAH